MISETLRRDLKYNLAELDCINKRLAQIGTLPEGRVHVRKDRITFCKSVTKDGKRVVSEKKVTRAQARIYLQKEYYEKEKVLLERITAREKIMLKDCEKLEKNLTQETTARYGNILYENPVNRLMGELWAWSKADYPTNTLYPDRKRTHTVSGVFVRSKSEALIANLLTSKGIPFRYENELIVGGRKRYPDFTIKLPNGDYIIWEHLGILYLMDYTEKQRESILFLTKAGYRQGDNLILTSESVNGDLNTEAISVLIANFIMPHFQKWAILKEAVK